jgi:enamine deaminase RidA (YjgF/YER057c/UK114 family)
MRKVQDRTRQVIQNLEAVLKGANMTLKNVVKANIYLSDLSKDFNAVNEVSDRFTIPFSFPISRSLP